MRSILAIGLLFCLLVSCHPKVVPVYPPPYVPYETDQYLAFYNSVGQLLIVTRTEAGFHQAIIDLKVGPAIVDELHLYVLVPAQEPSTAGSVYN